MPFQPGNKLSPPPPKRRKGDSVIPYIRARRAVGLSAFGLNNAEVANLLGCSERTVRRYLAQEEMKAIRNRIISESDQRAVMLRFMSNVSKLCRDFTYLDDLEKALREGRLPGGEILNDTYDKAS